MQKSILGHANGPYNFFKQREREFKAEAHANKGKLPRHQIWRREYYQHPYLILEENRLIIERFKDIYINTIDISKEGKITPTPFMDNDARLGRLFTQILEETNWRGALTPDIVSQANEQIRAYFKDGLPLGCRMFGDREHIPGKWLVKYSKSEFVRDMLEFGRFRISPAHEYSKGSYIKAIKDLETARPYKLKALNEVLEGKNSINFQGRDVKIENGFLPIEFMIDDYFIFSTCKEINRRMPTDFEADAALIIKDKKRFLKMFKLALLEKFPDWQFLEGEVLYYDPYNDIPNNPNQELLKHFSYSYQKEHRCVLRRRVSPAPYIKLEPFFIELGPLLDIAEAVYVS